MSSLLGAKRGHSSKPVFHLTPRRSTSRGTDLERVSSNESACRSTGCVQASAYVRSVRANSDTSQTRIIRRHVLFVPANSQLAAQMLLHCNQIGPNSNSERSVSGDDRSASCISISGCFRASLTRTGRGADAQNPCCKSAEYGDERRVHLAAQLTVRAQHRAS